MEDQRPHFNTLSISLMFRLGVNKGSMGHTASPSIKLRIKALDKRDQVWSLGIAVIPLDVRIRSHVVRLALAVGIDKLNRHKVTIGYRVRIRDSQRVLQDGLDRTPDVDDLVSALEELGRIVGEVIGDSALGCFVGLVYVHSLHGSAELGTK